MKHNFDIYFFSIKYCKSEIKEGFLLKSKEGRWGEVSPYPTRNRETLKDAWIQLKQLQSGWRGELYPSVAFGLYSLECSLDRLENQWPICLLLQGTKREIEQYLSKKSGYTYVKLKTAHLSVKEAIDLVSTLKSSFKIRIDIGEKWSLLQLETFFSHFQPEDFEYIEDPGTNISPFPLAFDIHNSDEGTIIWKPMVKGIPIPNKPVILSSSYETGIGLAHIAFLAERQKIPLHALGIGTYDYMQEEILQEPISYNRGILQLPPQLTPKTQKLQLC